MENTYYQIQRGVPLVVSSPPVMEACNTQISQGVSCSPEEEKSRGAEKKDICNIVVPLPYVFVWSCRTGRQPPA